MIDRDKFLAGMALLSGAYGREIDGPVQRLYFGILNAKLTTEEFEQAIATVTATETFWPSPAVILGKVPRLTTDHAALAFDLVNRTLSEYGGHRFLPHAVFQDRFDVPTRVAIAAIGGLSFISSCTEERWGTLTRKFETAYREAQTNALAAPDHKLIASGDR